MTFRVGQKVVCVDATGETHIRQDAVYTVTRTDWQPEFINVDCCAEHANLMGAGWLRRRFRPIVEHKTDISIFKRMLTDQKVEA